MTDCPSCKEAETNPKTGSFHSGCFECDARALAQSPAAWRAMSGITATDLQDAIARVFGLERYREGRVAVWAWIEKLKEASR